MSQVALIVALADRAYDDVPRVVGGRERMTRIVDRLLDQPDYAAASVDMVTALRLVATAKAMFRA